VIPTYFAVLVLVASLLASPARMLSIFVVSCLFGGSAALVLSSLGGAPITPAAFALPFLVMRALQRAGLQAYIDAMKIRDGGLWLLLVVVLGALGAYALPRLFQGTVMVEATDRNSLIGGVVKLPLRPSSGNLTQACYAIGDLLAFGAVLVLVRAKGGMNVFRNAVLLMAGLNVLAAVLGLAQDYFGLPRFMNVIRNANYAVFGASEVAGLIRITGTFPETSAFAAFTAPLLAFTASLWRSGECRRVAGWLALSSFALMIISTSTTAYATLVMYAAFLFGAFLWRSLLGNRGLVFGYQAVATCGLLVCACLFLLFWPQAVDRIVDFFQLTLVTKLDSSSGVERSSWNAQAWQNFLDTDGLGVGLGSARASSFPLALLSNLGVIGAVLFVAFAIAIFRGAFADGVERPAVQRASGHAVLAGLIASTISGSVFDLGLAFYAFAAAAVAVGPTTPRFAVQHA
jgi:hypothetical protein